MLSNIGNSAGRKIYSLLIDSLRKFKFQNIRNTEQIECRNGEQFWCDIHRSEVSINGIPVNFQKLKETYMSKYSEELIGYQHRTASYNLLNSAFKAISGYKIQDPLLDELITILHQGGLHGALYLGITHALGAHIQQDICSANNSFIVPKNRNHQTNIEVLSPTTLQITYQETRDYIESSIEEILFSTSSTLSLNITKIDSKKVLYHSLVISTELPREMMPNTERENIIEAIISTFRRLHSLVTSNNALEIESDIKVIQQGNNFKLIHCIPNNYLCSPIKETVNPICQQPKATHDSIVLQQQTIQTAIK